MKWLSRSLIAVLASCLLAVPGAAPSSAYELQCGRFIGSDPTLTYRFNWDGNPDYSGAFNWAKDQWNAPPYVPTHFVLSASTDTELKITSGYYPSNSDWAWVQINCPAGSIYWENNKTVIRVNATYFSDFSINGRRHIMAHELGHVLGLGHRGMTCSVERSIMEQGTEPFGCLGDPPWDDDKDGVKARYS